LSIPSYVFERGLLTNCSIKDECNCLFLRTGTTGGSIQLMEGVFLWQDGQCDCHPSDVLS
jgi:hypothetical protein